MRDPHDVIRDALRVPLWLTDDGTTPEAVILAEEDAT